MTTLNLSTVATVWVISNFHKFKKTILTSFQLCTFEPFQALYDYQPRENDVQPMGAWLTVMEHAHINLTRYAPLLPVTIIDNGDLVIWYDETIIAL